MLNVTPFLLALALVLGAVQTASAGWFETNLSGNSCLANAGGQPVIPTRYGIYNPSSYSAAEVTCPIQVPRADYTYGYIGISAYRRNQNDGLSCTINMSNDDGSYWTSAVATIPAGNTGRQYATRYTNATVGSRTIWVTCHIPASVSGNNSYLTNIYINLNGG